MPQLRHLTVPLSTATLAVGTVGVGVGLVSGGEGPRIDLQNASPPTIATAAITIAMSGK